MRMMAQAWVCEYKDCGHIWLNLRVNDAPPKQCAKCRRRGWNKADGLTISNAPLTGREIARGREIWAHVESQCMKPERTVEYEE